MTELWTSQIIVDGNPNPFEDIHLWSISEHERTVVPSKSALRLISDVYLSSIPLYLVAGCSSQVSTDNASTAAWLYNRLIPDDWRDIDRLGATSDTWKQLDTGLLLETGETGLSGEATELLLYAEVQNQESLSVSSDPTLSLQSIDGLAQTQTQSHLRFKVYALPLCSGNVTKAHIAAEGGAKDLTRPASSSNRRKSMTNLFEDAMLRRKKFNGRGGERVLKAMSNSDHVVSQNGWGLSAKGGEMSDTTSLGQKNVSRASSFAFETCAAKATFPSQEASIIGSLVQNVDSTFPANALSSANEDSSNYTEQNKTALTKVVLAGMRFHGLQQKKKKSAQTWSGSDLKQKHSDQSPEPPEDTTDEYKIIYHQTFKAAMFALRGQFSIQSLDQETMRDVVDRLLVLFCSNNLGVNGSSGSREVIEPVNVITNTFDKPSDADSFVS